jgi:hypothetical protein
VDDCKLEGKIADQLALPVPPPKLAVPDYELTGKLKGATADWWKKNIQRA